MTVETDSLRRTQFVQAGSGFISQHSKELLFGLGQSRGSRRSTFAGRAARRQVLTDVPLDHRVYLEEGGAPRYEPFSDGAPPRPRRAAAEPRRQPAERDLALRALPAPDFGFPTSTGRSSRSRACAASPRCCSSGPRRRRLRAGRFQELAARQRRAERRPERALLAVALDAPAELAKVRAAAQAAPGLPVALGNEEVGDDLHAPQSLPASSPRKTCGCPRCSC